jgi:hypothetical protein
MNLAVAYRGNPACGRLDRDTTPITARERSTEDQHCGAQIAELFDLDPEISPGRLDVGQKLPDATTAAIDVALGTSDNARAHLDVGMGELFNCGVDGMPTVRIENPRTISTFSCDIAYSCSPAAARASAGSRYEQKWTTLPSRKVQVYATGPSASIPL